MMVSMFLPSCPWMRIPCASLCLTLTLLCGCTTIQNRRDLYFPQQVRGPYTRMLDHGLKANSQAATPIPSIKGSGDGKRVIRPQG